MTRDKKLWRLPIPFRRSPCKQDQPVKAKAEHSGSHVSSVYLSDRSSANGFIIVPEFDDSQKEHEELLSNPSPSLSPLSPIHDGYTKLIGSQDSFHSLSGSHDPVGVNTRTDDLTQRLGSAYERIRLMPGVPSPRVSLSSDPQMLRKQLGVPQHSVLNHPIHSPLDLPNPYTSPRGTMSPCLPPTTPPDVPHTTSKKAGLRIDTNVHPPFPRQPLPDHFQPSQECLLTVSTPTETSPIQCTALPWKPPIVSSSKPRPAPTKLVKRRIGKPVVSPSLLSSSRFASSGVVRKLVADTPSSINMHKWQNSLPQIRSPSPFRVDIPLHHAWHDRRTNFHSSVEGYSQATQFHDTRLRRTSGSTEILASLAWIGTSPTTSPYAADRTRRSASSTFLPDCFNMAIAVEDDSLSDDVLVDHLEKVRRTGGSVELSGLHSTPWGSTQIPVVEGNANGSFSSSPTPDQLGSSCDVLLPSSPTSNDTNSDSEDVSVWRSARKAFLCIREIVRTEKKYQEALKILLNAQTVTPPPPSMTPYISALVRVSEVLLKHFLEDPSAWGVSTAFVTSEDELEATLVSWCAVAGTFFTNEDDPRPCGSTGKWRLRKSGIISTTFTTKTAFASPQLPSIFSLSNSVGKTKEWADDGQYLKTDQKRQAASVCLQKPESSDSKFKTGQPPSRKLSVRDLAIQPIQRVMRYVLLYKDLLECTPPTSPSRLLVERALEAAMRIANHCNKAQKNPAFYLAS